MDINATHKYDEEMMRARQHRVCSIADVLAEDRGALEEHGPAGDFCQYYTPLQMASWINLIKDMRNDNTLSKDDALSIIQEQIYDGMQQSCATKSWAGYLDVNTNGDLSPSQFKDESND